MKKTLDTTVISNELVEGSSFFPKSPEVTPTEPNKGQIFAQKVEQVSKPLSNGLSESTNKPQRARNSTVPNLPTQEDIELMAFELRKAPKTKVNTEVVEEWKEELNKIAFNMHIGKYQLVEFIIGEFLGKVRRKNSS